MTLSEDEKNRIEKRNELTLRPDPVQGITITVETEMPIIDPFEVVNRDLDGYLDR
jgi:hypothetical protein